MFADDFEDTLLMSLCTDGSMNPYYLPEVLHILLMVIVLCHYSLGDFDLDLV